MMKPENPETAFSTFRRKTAGGTLAVRGTSLEERDENQRQLLLERNLSHPWEQHRDPASPEKGDESSRSQPTKLSKQTSRICETS